MLRMHTIVVSSLLTRKLSPQLVPRFDLAVPKFNFAVVTFKKLYKNSAWEQGTVRYFREKLQRRNVTIDVKHYENCEQLFLTLG
ncbi:hypothetical protein P5673_010741 [Acropora cervicornis]|uniref:Uncharacterized protein n=1 Tax=Acropora cervicornis TaxID=6130 RepID=A0AAD9QQK8_ACRCE|nr:hypothetical protein P5673_010741 [Acropora cervicornis]